MKSHITLKLGVVLELLIFPKAGLIYAIFMEIIRGWETHKHTCWSGLLTYFCRTVPSNQSNQFPLLLFFFLGGGVGRMHDQTKTPLCVFFPFNPSLTVNQQKSILKSSQLCLIRYFLRFLQKASYRDPQL